MKKMWILIVMAAAIITSCGQEILDSGSDITETAPIVFNLTANHPDATKAVKTGWEAGDAIFVFFTGVEAPRHLKMTYDGSKWTSAEYDGATQTAGALGLTDGKTGTMRAVFLPFGSDAMVSADGTSFTFSTTYYAYYLTATLPYTVTNHTVSGSFKMEIPADYVQFFINDESATDDDAYRLGTDAVIPVGVASITAAGIIVETTDVETLAKKAGDDMTGYAYGTDDDKGYLFSGKLTTWNYDGYYFAKTKTADQTRADYFVTGKTLESHSAVKLPANDNVYIPGSGDGKWILVGPGKFVNLYRPYPSNIENPFVVSWATCNYGASRPEEKGTLLAFKEAKDAANDNNVYLPSKDLFNLLANQTIVKHTAITVHGKSGFVISASRGFLFLPVTSIDGFTCDYWSGEEYDQDNTKAWYFNFAGTTVEGADYTYNQGKEAKLAVRMVL
ncbi:MAG: hypothetical protein IJP77_05460 [Bacteroidales bacterium]|nr:hypothetical protein [Bacteroidales bacterium]